MLKGGYREEMQKMVPQWLINLKGGHCTAVAAADNGINEEENRLLHSFQPMFRIKFPKFGL